MTASQWACLMCLVSSSLQNVHVIKLLLQHLCVKLEAITKSKAINVPERLPLYLKVAEITNNVSIFLLVALVLEPENCRDEVRETQELCNDGISSGNYPEDGLAAQVVLCQEVHHGGWRKRRRKRRRVYRTATPGPCVFALLDTPAEKSKTRCLKSTGSSIQDFLMEFLFFSTRQTCFKVSLSKTVNAWHHPTRLVLFLTPPDRGK